MEPTKVSMDALAEGAVLLIVLALAVVAAVAPLAVIVLGLPTLVAYQLWASKRSRRS